MHSLAFLRSVVSLRDKRVLLRIDANVPTGKNGVGDVFRLERVLPTLRFLLEGGARVVVISHREEKDAIPSLGPVADYFAQYFPVKFFPGEPHDAASVVVAPGEALFLENIRRDPREEANDRSFGKELAALGEIFVNDAFAVMHRSHASTVGVPGLLPSVGGFLLEEELLNVGKLLEPQKPCVAIIGGLKFKTKAPLIEKFLKVADQVFVVGALANSFYKAEGHEVGVSVVDPDYLSVKPFINHPKISVPRDVLVERGGERYTVALANVLPGEKIVDAGPSGIEKMAQAVRSAASVLWNGPLGLYEGGYGEGTAAFARALAASSAFRVIGGGDTISAVRSAGLLDQFDFASTGGGAMLDYLAKGTLPGIKALEESAQLFRG